MMSTTLRIEKARHAIVGIVLGLLASSSGRADSLELASRAFGHETSQRASWPLQWSDSGRFLLIQSEATGLIPGQLDFNSGKELFLLDLWKDQAFLLSRHYENPLLTVGSNGVLSSNSFRPRMTPDAEFVVFESWGSSMVAGQIDTNGSTDVFVWERATDELELISHLPEQPSVTGDAASTFATISADGRFIAFSSRASNLVVDAVDSNDAYDVFVLDRELSEMRLVSRSVAKSSNSGNDDSWAPVLRHDGASLIFSSDATDLVAGVVDANGASDVFEWSASTEAVTLLSSRFDSPLATANGASGFWKRSSDDRFLTLSSLATDLEAGVTDGNAALDVYLLDRSNRQMKLVSHQAASTTTAGNGESRITGMSDDGRYLTLSTRATDLVAGMTDGNSGRDIVQWDRATDLTRLVSHAYSSPLISGDGECLDSGGSASGRYVSFLSLAENHVSGVTDSNNSTDLFVWDRDSGQIRLASHREHESLTTGDSGIFDSVMTRDGAIIAFNSASDDYDFDDADGNGVADNFVWSRIDDEIELAYRLPEAAVVASVSASLTDVDRSGRRILMGGGVFDRGTRAWIPVPYSDSVVGSGGASAQDMSADGRSVLLSLPSVNLSGSPRRAGQPSEVFHWSPDSNETLLVSHSAISPTKAVGGAAVALSDDGRFTLFDSEAPDIVAGQVDSSDSMDAFLWDRTTNSSVLVSHLPGMPTTSGEGQGRLVSADGEFVVFESPGQPWPSQIHRFRRSDGAIELVSRAHGGAGTVGGDAASWVVGMSHDGRWIAFRSTATNLVAPPVSSPYQQAYLYDAFDGSVRLLSRSVDSPGSAANHESEPLAISADGAVVLLGSRASDLVPGLLDENDGPDLFLWRAGRPELRLVTHSHGSPLVAANSGSWLGDLNDAGDTVAYASVATDLVAAPNVDAPGTLDAFYWGVANGTSRLLSVSAVDRTIAAGDSVGPIRISGLGSVVAFESDSIQLVSADRPYNSWTGVFAWFSGLFEDGFESGDAGAWSDFEP